MSIVSALLRAARRASSRLFVIAAWSVWWVAEMPSSRRQTGHDREKNLEAMASNLLAPLPLVAMPFVTSSVLAPSSKVRSP